MISSIMAMFSPRMQLFKCLVLMISIISTISNGHARARILASNIPSSDKPKGTIKSIESYETGEVIDCVDIYKQPALNHPLLKNHTIEVKPSSNQKGNRAGYVEGALHQTWWKYDECPEGTIPIIRTQNHTNRHVAPLSPLLEGFNMSGNELNEKRIHEHAIAFLTGGKYTGARATINVWKPKVMDTEVSSSQMWLFAGNHDSLNTVVVGWTVSESYSPKIFIYWTSDGYRQTGCYNLECDGFVQTSSEIALGARLEPFSTYGGQQYDLSVHVKRDNITGRWWLSIWDIEVGYWPYEIFTSLKGPANRIHWGGQIVNAGIGGHHTSTQMGSGYFPSEGFGKAAFFRYLKFLDEGHIERDPVGLKQKVSRPQCYDLKLNVEPPSFGVNFYYGGPGFSPQCVI